MKNLRSFLRQCIAEVIVEPVPQPPKKMKGLRPLIKHCIAEVIIEPGMTAARMRQRVMQALNKRVHVVGSPKKFNMNALIKECTLEVLKENILKEAFDPTSQGPNIAQDNPYPAWNAQMAKMEEEEHPHGRYAQQAGATPFQTPQDYEEIKTFQEIRDKEDPKGLHHDLRLECVHCGTTHTCRCSKPKRKFKGCCESCAKVSLKEWSPEEDVIAKVKKEVYATLGRAGGWQHLGDEPRDYMEFYLNGFVTVSIYISFDDHKAHVERYYDSEMVDQMPGHHLNKTIPIPPQYDPNFVQNLVKLCVGLKNRSAGDESIFGGIDDLQEHVPTLEWKCPHCKKKAGILLEVESPSDYIAIADCQHCGKEITDPKLDKAIYEVVMKHYTKK